MMFRKGSHLMRFWRGFCAVKQVGFAWWSVNNGRIADASWGLLLHWPSQPQSLTSSLSWMRVLTTFRPLQSPASAAMEGFSLPTPRMLYFTVLFLLLKDLKEAILHWQCKLLLTWEGFNQGWRYSCFQWTPLKRGINQSRHVLEIIPYSKPPLSLSDLPVFHCEVGTYASAVYLSFHAPWPPVWGQPTSQPISTRLYTFFYPLEKNREGSGKCLISLSFSWRGKKNHHQHRYYLTPTSPPMVAPWLTQPHLRNRAPFLIQSTQIRLTLCKVSWKTDVARVTYRNLLIAFHCLAFPFYPFKSTYNGNPRMS